MSITEVFRHDPIHPPEIFSALKEQLRSTRAAESGAFPAVASYPGGWNGGLLPCPNGTQLVLGAKFDDGTKLDIVSDCGIGLPACYGGGRIETHRAPAELPSLKLWAELFATPGLPGWPPWLRVDLYAGEQFIGRASGPVLGVTVSAYTRARVVCRKG